MNSDTIKCPFCAEEILKDSKKCKFCKEDFIKSEKNNDSKKNEDTEYFCTACKEKIHKDAEKCKHCGARLTVTTFVEDAVNTVGTGFNIVWKTLIVLLVLLFVMYMCVASM